MSDIQIDLLKRIVSPKNGHMVTFVNLYSYRFVRKMSRMPQEFDVIHLDGFLLTWYFRLLGYKISRQSFDMTSLAASVFDDAEAQSKTVILIGGEGDVSALAADVLRDKYPNLKITANYAGFFDDRDHRSRVVNAIVSAQPDIVVVGMGASMQENMLIDLKDNGFTGAGYTCGGFLHQIASGKVDYYPTLINKLGLRWVYRCIKEPKVIRRVLVDYPKNTLLFWGDALRWKRG